MNKTSEIKDLNQIGRRENILFHKENTVTNILTGEVSEVGTTFIKRAKSRDNFLKLFVENIDFLVRLDNQEKTLFFYLLIRVDYNNIISFDTSLKHALTSKKVMGRTSMYKALQGLVEKKVIFEIDEKLSEEITSVRIKDCYLLNPNLVGRGSWNELKKLRHSIKREMDFEKLEIKQVVEIEAEYDGLEEVLENTEQYELDRIEHKVSMDGRNQDLNIYVNEKEKARIQPSLLIASQDDNIIDTEANTISYSKKQSPLSNINTYSTQTQQNNSIVSDNAEIKKENKDFDENLELIKEKAKLKALELELKNKDIELKKLLLKEHLIKAGNFEEAEKIKIK